MLCITNNSIKQSFVYIQLNDQTVLFLTLQFSMSFAWMQLKWSNSSIWLIDKALSSANTQGQSGPGSNDNEGALHIPQNSRTGASSSDGLMPYPKYLLKESSTGMLSMYSTAPANWAFMVSWDQTRIIWLHRLPVCMKEIKWSSSSKKYCLYN